MSVLKLDIHQTTALALFDQRQLYLQQPLVEAQLLLISELDLMCHLQVLRDCQSQWPQAQDPAAIFLQALGQNPEQQDPDWLCETLLAGGPEQQALVTALCWQPSLRTTAELVELYQQQSELRPLLFDLWRHRRDQIPTGLTSAAELRSQAISLQSAALRYAASRPEIGHDLFLPYFRDLHSAAPGRDIPGQLLATALWGSLLRGTGRIYETLWRSIERENEPAALYQLLRLGALLATPELPDVLRQYAKEHPAEAAELLALHGTKGAIDTLADLSPTTAAEPAFQAAWLWVSGDQLQVEPRLQLVGKQPPSNRPSAQDWWHSQRDQLSGEQRLLFGQPLTLERVRVLAGLWGGRYSANLLDLLAWLQKAPVSATERIPFSQRLRLLNSQGGQA